MASLPMHHATPHALANEAAAWLFPDHSEDSPVDTGGTPWECGLDDVIEQLTALPPQVLAALAGFPRRCASGPLQECAAQRAYEWLQCVLWPAGETDRAVYRLRTLSTCLACADELEALAATDDAAWEPTDFQGWLTFAEGCLDAEPRTNHINRGAGLCEESGEVQELARAVVLAGVLVDRTDHQYVADEMVEFIRSRLDDPVPLIRAARDRRSLDPAVLLPALDHEVPALAEGAL
ncbi:hypothetical protein ACX801_07915 [Arthrobacter bambusae]